MPAMPTQCNYVFLTENELERVKQWRYRVVDGSLTTKLFTPLWNWMARYLPVGVAPNVITLWAAMCVAAAYHLVTDVDVGATIGPRTARLLAVAFSSGYITLDALDGKHARNTNNSSALGELFDHGCVSRRRPPAWRCCWSALCRCSAVVATLLLLPP